MSARAVHRAQGTPPRSGRAGYDRRALLGAREPVAFVTVSDPARALAFYRDALGLELVADEPFALVFRLGPIELRLAKADRVDPAPGTVLGWRVPDIGEALKTLGDARSSRCATSTSSRTAAVSGPRPEAPESRGSPTRTETCCR